MGCSIGQPFGNAEKKKKREREREREGKGVSGHCGNFGGNPTEHTNRFHNPTFFLSILFPSHELLLQFLLLLIHTYSFHHEDASSAVRGWLRRFQSQSQSLSRSLSLSISEQQLKCLLLCFLPDNDKFGCRKQEHKPGAVASLCRAFG